MLKRYLCVWLLVLSLLLPFGVVVPSANADVNLFPSQVCDSKSGSPGTTPQKTVVCQQRDHQENAKDNPVITALKVTIDIMSYIVGVSSIIILVLAGIRMVTSAGDPQSFGKARSSIIYALIGIAIVIAAQTIVVFVLNKL